jgi:hypothetical protein
LNRTSMIKSPNEETKRVFLGLPDRQAVPGG